MARVSVLRTVGAAAVAAVAVGAIALTDTASVDTGAGPCDLSATTATFAAQVTAASTGQSVCLAAGSYGTWTGTSKAITIRAAAGASPTMALNLSSSAANFTIDGGMSRWDSATGLTITSALIGNGAHDITVKNANVVGSGRVVTFNQPPNPRFVLDHLVLKNCTSGEALIYVDHSATEPASTGITIKRSLFYNSSCDGVKLANDASVDVINNKFLHMIDGLGGSTNHTDAIQFYSGTGSHIRGNWVDDCNQAISGFDGQSSALIEHNVVSGCTGHWFTYMADSPASTVQFNTVADPSGTIICGGKAGLSQASHTKLLNNVARGIALVGEGPTCTPDANDHNLVDSGATAGNLNGAPVFAGGSTPTTFAGFCLASGSPGRTGASDGTQVGACGGDYNSATDGPPAGEGF